MSAATKTQTLTPVIGLEIHVQLKTKSKMFCSCSNDGENQPANTTVCPVCMGHPGTLPVPNREAVSWALKTSMALHCRLQDFSKFDRKNYFYPDLPKGYQISQFDQPIGPTGYLDIDFPAGRRRIRITRLHLEEDAAKNFHAADGKHTLVDYNRAGTPLMEIVSEPDLRTPQEAKLFLQELRLMMRYLGVSEADMEKGHLRCDANISLTDQPADNIDIAKLHPKTEVKNLNSFKAVERALEYEIKRQTKLWEAGTPPDSSSTRGWDENRGVTEQQRTKEASHDYRYFPEPDIPPLHLGLDVPGSLNFTEISQSIGELPDDRRRRFHSEYGLAYDQARVLTDDRGLADFFEHTMSELRGWLISLDSVEGTREEIWEQHKAKLAKLTANWLVNKLLGILYKAGQDINASSELTPENFAEFITLLHQSKINASVGLQILEIMHQTGTSPTAIVEEEKLGASAEAVDLDAIIDQVIAENPKQVEQYKGGKLTVLQFFVGQVMRVTKGQADAQELADKLTEKLK